jgi:hypothetical protein
MRKLNEYSAQQIAQMSYDDLFALPAEWHKIKFGDGDVITKDRITKLSAMLWAPFKAYPEVPILKEHHLQEQRVTAKSLVKMLNKIIWHIYATNPTPVDPEHLARLAIEAKNVFYNQSALKLPEYFATLSMFEINDVWQHPKVREANTDIEPTTHGIEGVAYKKLKDAFMDPDLFIGNSIIEGLKSGTQKIEQLYQAFGPRGFPTDINSDIFPEPVMQGYIEGIWGLYENMVESRSGTKALLYNKELLRVTEYFNRKSQLIAQYVRNLHRGDCGADYVTFPVMKGYLKSMNGKFYLNEETGKMDVLTGEETHLIGKRIKMRSVIGCVHKDPQGVCSTCYGLLADNIPHGTNIGQVAAVSMGDKITSSVLSTKHTDATSAVEQYKLGGIEANYLREGAQSETLYLKKELAGKGFKLMIARAEAEHLADVLMIENLHGYPPTSATEMTRCGLVRNVNGEDVGDVLTVSLYNRKASLSLDMLKHVKEVRWTPDDRGNIIIDMEGFDFNLPFLTLPYKHVNMYEVMKRIQSFLHSGSDTEGSKLSSDKVGFTSKTYLKNYSSVIEGVVATAQLVNEKIHLPWVHCEVLAYAMTVKSIQQKDFNLPKPGISGQFEKYNKLMQSRDLAGTMAFEKQHEPFANPASFLYTQRNDHPYVNAVMGGKLN